MTRPLNEILAYSRLACANCVSATQTYATNAVIPTGSWNRLDDRSLEILRCTPPAFQPGGHVAVVSVSSRTLQLFQSIINGDYEPVKLRELTSQPIYQRFLGAVFADLDAELEIDLPFEIQGLAMHPPGLSTVTLDRRTGLYIGLHVDTWDGLAPGDAHRARSRLCINLGTEPRQFIFLPETLSHFAGSLPNLRKLVPDGAAAALLSAHSKRLILRLTLQPGEAYLAPTDNLIHDASTIGRGTLDCSLNLRGFFALKSRSLSR